MGIVGGNTCLFEREKYWSSHSETSCQDSVTWSKISWKVQLLQPHLQDAGHYRRPQWDSAGEKWLNCENGGKSPKVDWLSRSGAAMMTSLAPSVRRTRGMSSGFGTFLYKCNHKYKCACFFTNRPPLALRRPSTPFCEAVNTVLIRANMVLIRANTCITEKGL